MQRIVNKLIKLNKTISTMESCTGGYIVNEITNIPNASKILKYSAVTYSNEFKIKMGVDKNIIDTYTVYSKETAESMAKAISTYTNSDYGIGITGTLKKVDENNPTDKIDKVYISIYIKDENKYINIETTVTKDNRIDNKKEILTKIVDKMLDILA